MTCNFYGRSPIEADIIEKSEGYFYLSERNCADLDGMIKIEYLE
jgi:hypothetical protein